MASMSFYKEIIPLEKQKHKNLKLKLQDTYAFAEKSNSTPVAGFEFFMASRSFPIMFNKDAKGNFTPLALLSLRAEGHDLGGTWEGC